MPFVDENGKPFKYVSIRTDITVRKEMEAALEQALGTANAATKAKSEFLANMSHEIRTPMNAIIGLTGLCLKTDLTAKQRDYLNRSHASAEALLGIINDILDFSKIEAGKLDIEMILFDLDRVLDNLSALMSVKAQEKSLELLFFRSPEVPRYLIGDPLRLGQVLANLANNAIKFTTAGEVVISAQAVAMTKDEIEMEFSVRDTGIGLSQDQVRRLFRPFTQSDASTTRKFGGTGLGLAISKQLVELMGGDFRVDSAPGVGSTFFFDLVLKIPDELPNSSHQTTMGTDGLNILVADDSTTSCEILEAYLRSFSCQVVTCHSGEAAIEILRQSTGVFDLILMDWRMPGLNGLETAIAIKTEILPQAPPKIMLITAFDCEDIAGIPGAECLDNILSKPINPSLLFNAIMESFSDTPLLSDGARLSGSLCILASVN